MPATSLTGGHSGTAAENYKMHIILYIITIATDAIKYCQNKSLFFGGIGLTCSNSGKTCNN